MKTGREHIIIIIITIIIIAVIMIICPHTSTGKKDQEACSRPRFSLLRVMVRTFCGDVLLSYLYKLCSDLLQYLGPLLLK